MLRSSATRRRRTRGTGDPCLTRSPAREPAGCSWRRWRRRWPRTWRRTARNAITRFAGEYGAKYPKAVTTLEKDADALLTFFDFPAEHWKHLRTSNVIESPFATVRLRQRVTKGAPAHASRGSRSLPSRCSSASRPTTWLGARGAGTATVNSETTASPIGATNRKPHFGEGDKAPCVRFPDEAHDPHGPAGRPDLPHRQDPRYAGVSAGDYQCRFRSPARSTSSSSRSIRRSRRRRT